MKRIKLYSQAVTAAISWMLHHKTLYEALVNEGWEIAYSLDQYTPDELDSICNRGGGVRVELEGDQFVCYLVIPEEIVTTPKDKTDIPDDVLAQLDSDLTHLIRLPRDDKSSFFIDNAINQLRAGTDKARAGRLELATRNLSLAIAHLVMALNGKIND